MRCFIAVDINKKVRRGIKDLQQDLLLQSGIKEIDAKWVDPKNIHLTLKFLGEVRDQDITEVCRIVEDVASDHKCFSMNVEGLGSFGRPARVIWAGIDETDDLGKLQGDIDDRLSQAGWPKDRKGFSGHLTLCRVKNFQTGERLEQIIKDYGEVELGSVLVDSVYVYRSDLTSKGPEYSVISRSSLREK